MQNITNYSPTDPEGGYVDVAAAVERGVAMAAEGAAIVDVGGESTRPGAGAVSAAEELERVIPVIERLAALTDVPISIDTYKADVARRALEAGAVVVNDINQAAADRTVDFIRNVPMPVPARPPYALLFAGAVATMPAEHRALLKLPNVPLTLAKPAVGAMLGTLQLALPGAHNRSNALAAIAAARHVGVDPAAALEALARFGGVKRRLEVRGTVAGVTVIDDFAHHPTAIRETIAALRGQLGTARILAVLEPRSNTMKQGVVKAQLAASLQAADRVFCFSGPGVGWDVATTLSPLGARASAHDALPALVDAVLAVAQPGDRILVMSNGGFGGVHDTLLERLAERAAVA
jgi:UDP-N-acetylmuramoylalanine-D-glutamate ligase